jgi:hypothetical protein
MPVVETPAVVAPAGVPETETDSVSVPSPPAMLSPVVSVSVVAVLVSCALNVSSPVPPVKLEPASKPVVSELVPHFTNLLFLLEKTPNSSTAISIFLPYVDKNYAGIVLDIEESELKTMG